jgi:mannose-6-phosphate isomerase-like protein (cupin superfamily)
MTATLSTRGRMADPAAGDLVDFSKTPSPETFNLRIQLLDEGSRSHILSDTGNLNIKIRCYAAGGGENAMHAHHNQDHSFIVLQGQARFYGPRGEVRDLGRNDGIMLPAGCYYCFENLGSEPLVVLRIESITKEGVRTGGDRNVRLGMHGQQIEPHAPENNREKPIRPRPNAFYE